MSRALSDLSVSQEGGVALVDGPYVPQDIRPMARGLAVIHGDALCLSIAAASIVAKVERDRHMGVLDLRHPGYGFARHAGYGTKEHREALLSLGPCPEHRRTFRPIQGSIM